MDEKIVKDSQCLAKDLANDCISRQGVSAWLANRGYRGLANKVMDEDRFPSAQLKSYREGYQAGFKDAQPDRKRGKWIYYTDEGYVECPFCHSATNCDGNKDELHFCFSCGADMRGEQE